MKFGRSKPGRPALRQTLERLGEFGYRVANTSYYQRALNEIAGGRTEHGHEFETTAEIALDDQSRRDSTAVLITIHDRTVGYLARDNAREYRQWLRNQHFPDHTIMKCTALVSGGWDRGRNNRGAYEVSLDLPPLDVDWTY